MSIQIAEVGNDTSYSKIIFVKYVWISTNYSFLMRKICFTFIDIDLIGIRFI